MRPLTNLCCWGGVESVVAPGRWGVWAGSAVLLKETCFHSRAVCPPSESQGQPISTLRGAMDRPQALLRAYRGAMEKQRKVCKLSARCFLPAIGKSKVNPKGRS